MPPSTALAVGAARWWVRTWNAQGLGPWSAPLDFTLQGLGAATLVSPLGVLGTATPTYIWNAEPTATYYYLWVNDSSATPKITQWYSASAAGCGTGTGTCAVAPGTPLALGAGRWWIHTWNPAGYGPWSTPLDFIR